MYYVLCICFNFIAVLFFSSLRRGDQSTVFCIVSFNNNLVEGLLGYLEFPLLKFNFFRSSSHLSPKVAFGDQRIEGFRGTGKWNRGIKNCKQITQTQQVLATVRSLLTCLTCIPMCPNVNEKQPTSDKIPKSPQSASRAFFFQPMHVVPEKRLSKKMIKQVTH